MEWVIGFFLVVLLGVAIFLMFGPLFTVNQQTAAIVQRFGKFVRVAHSGLNYKTPLIEMIAGRINLRLQQLDVKVETKTEDNVFVHVIVAVQYHVLEDKVYEAFYRLANANQQITAFVFDVVRASRAPGSSSRHDLFEKKDEIADAVKNELSHVMHDFGYGIVKALVTDIDPDHTVKEAMNAINAAQQMQRGRAGRPGRKARSRPDPQGFKAAEAESSRTRSPSGQGDRRPGRRAIVDGLRESVDEFQKSIPGTSPQDVMNLVLMTQYFDTLKEIGAAPQGPTPS